MSHNPKYRGEFKDTHGIEWRIDLKKDAYASDLTNLVLSGEPLLFEGLSDSDDLLEPIRETTATIKAISQTDFALADLYAVEDLETKVEIYKGGSLTTGWTNDGTNPYETFSATGININVANSSGGGLCYTNVFTVVSGETIRISFFCVKNSGTLPTVKIINTGWTLEDSENMVEGWNIFDLVPTWSGDARIVFWENVGVNGNFTITNLVTYRPSQLYWQGWIISKDYQEPYELAPYEVEIKASDGINYLKEYLFCATDAVDFTDIVFYDGRTLESEIILNILGKVGFTEFKEFCNIYEQNMSSGTGDSPFDQCKIDVDVFKGKYCHDVLQHILKKYGAIIRMKAGCFELTRPVELTGATVYGRYFTGISTKTSISKSPAQYLHSSANVSNNEVIPGGMMLIQSPVKKVTINQDYGSKDSWIENYNFNRSTYDDVGYTYQGWTATTCVAFPANYINTGETEGMMIVTHNAGAALTKCMEQSFGAYALQTNDVLNIELDFLFFNSGATVYGVHFYVEIRCGGKYLYMADTESCAWDASANYIDLFADAPRGNSGWFNIKRKVPTLPANGPLTIKIYGLPDSIPTVFPIINNIRFYSTSTQVPGLMVETTPGPKWYDYVNTIITFGIAKLPKAIPLWKFARPAEVVNKSHESGNTLTGISIEESSILGDVDDTGIDNVIEQFQGALVYVVSTLAGVATKFVRDWASYYLTGGVVVTSNGADIIFTAETAGVDFTGATSIANVSGNLNGSVVNTVANNSGAGQIDEVTWTAGAAGGRSTVSFKGLSHYVDYNTSLDQTAQDFVTNWTSAYGAIGVTLSKVGVAKIRFVGPVGVDCGTTTVTQTLTVLVGSVTSHTAAVAPVARVDTLTLSGSTGSANITCDAVTHLAQIGLNDYTTRWSTRGNSENKALIKLLCDNKKDQGARPRQFIDLKMYESKLVSSDTSIDVNGRFEHSVNKYSGNNRKFVVSAYKFEVKSRMWQMDLNEVL